MTAFSIKCKNIDGGREYTNQPPSITQMAVWGFRIKLRFVFSSVVRTVRRIIIVSKGSPVTGWIDMVKGSEGVGVQPY